MLDSQIFALFIIINVRGNPYYKNLLANYLLFKYIAYFTINQHFTLNT